VAPPRFDMSWPEVIEPNGTVEMLPESGPVGAAVLVHRLCDTCDTTLLMAGGRQFALPESDSVLAPRYSLSPDGGWLAARTERGAVVRDLAGEAVHEIGDTGGGVLVPWAWSPDSRWLLLGEVEPNVGVSHHLLVDLADGTAAAASADGNVLGVLASGHLVAVMVGRQVGDRPVTTLDVEVREASGDVVHAFTVDAGEWLQGEETLVWPANMAPHSAQVAVAPDGQGLLLAVSGRDTPELSILAVDLSGAVVSRMDVPGEAFQGWRVLGQVGGELVVAQARATDTFPNRHFTLYAVAENGLDELTTLVVTLGPVVRVAGTALFGGDSS
jgi:hypothetical protein